MTGHETTLPIDDADVSAFRRDGAICLRRLFGADQVEALREAVAWSMAHPGPHALDFSGDEAAGSFFADVFVWTRHAPYRGLVLSETLGGVAGRLMQSASARFYFDHLLVKEPSSGAPTPWHQDAPYWTMMGTQCCSIWIALDPVDETSGRVEYVRGSHAWGKYFAPASFSGGDRLKNAALEPTPDIDAHRSDYEILAWDLEPGDVAIHHCLTLHGASANETADRRRRGLALRFIGDDIVYDTRPGIPEPMTGSLADLAPELELGQPYRGEWFPEVWRADA